MRTCDLDRFWAKVEKTEGCWLWVGARSSNGYGVFTLRARAVSSHRAAYAHFVGPIPAGLVVDHLCGVRACVRPEHLEAVTQRVNLLRADTFQARNLGKTRCPQGHPYSEENTYRDRRGCRTCRECNRESCRQYRRRRAA